MLNKKAQVSIEVLAILSILVLGSIIFGVYYLSMTRKNIEVANKFDIGPDLYIDDGPVTNTDGTTPPVSPTDSFTLVLTGPGPSPINTNFNIAAHVNNYPITSDDNLSIIQITVYKDNGGNYQLNDSCKYDSNSTIIGVLSVDLKMQKTGDDHNYNLDKFSCSAIGNYKINIKAVKDSNTSITDDANVDVRIIDSSTPAEFTLSLDSTTLSLINQTFNVNSHVLNYPISSDDNIAIRNIKIEKYNGVFYVSSSDCNYGTTVIPASLGLDVNLKMQKDVNDHDYNLNQFSCSSAGNYKITVTAKLDSNNDISSTNQVQKTITSPPLPPGAFNLTLFLVPLGAAMVGTEFNILAEVKDFDPTRTINIKEIYVQRNGNPVNVCNYEGTEIPEDGLKELNLPMSESSAGNYELLLEKFRCTDFGDYNFILKAEDTSEPETYNDTDSIIKEIGCEYEFGTGTLVNPYQIWEPKDLHCVRYFLSSNFKVMTTIDLNHQILSYYTGWYDPISGWSPIIDPINSTIEFSANFNGNNQIIKNMHIYRPILAEGKGCDSGLFAGLDTTAIVRNLKIEDVNLALTGGGALFGYNYGSVDNVSVNGGQIQGSWSMGGLGGCNYGDGKIDQSNSNDLNVSLKLFPGVTGINATGFGGLIGENKGLINQCYSTADVNGIYSVGGLVGFHSNFLTGNQIGLNTLIINSYAKGQVSISDANTNAKYIGGLIGQLLVTPEIDDNYSTTLLLDRSYATGEIKNLGVNDWYHGGIIGTINLRDNDPWITGYQAIVENSYWDTDTSNEISTASISGIMADFGWALTTTEMKSISTYYTQHYYPEGDPNAVLYLPWNITVNSNTIWNIDSGINGGYPYLRNNMPVE